MIDFGKRPSLTPAHQVDLLTGMIGGVLVLGLPRIWVILRNPVSGNVFMELTPCYRKRCIPSLFHGVASDPEEVEDIKKPAICGFPEIIAGDNQPQSATSPVMSPLSREVSLGAFCSGTLLRGRFPYCLARQMGTHPDRNRLSLLIRMLAPSRVSPDGPDLFHQKRLSYARLFL